MNRETGMILRARKMAREQASRYFAPGEPGYQAKFEEIYTRLMREQLAFEDYRAGQGPARKNPYRPRRNPGSSLPLFPHLRHNPPEDIDPRPYEEFHGVEPSRIDEKKMWVPGELVLMGDAVDVGYKAKDHRSSKGQGPYVHDHDSGVRVFRRAKHGEHPDKVWTNFPTELTVMGKALGFTYRDNSGRRHEVKGGGTLCTTPSRRVLVVVGSAGVKYLIEGGNMHVSDWIRN